MGGANFFAITTILLQLFLLPSFLVVYYGLSDKRQPGRGAGKKVTRVVVRY